MLPCRFCGGCSDECACSAVFADFKREFKAKIDKLNETKKLADALVEAVEMYQEAYYAMAAPPPPGGHDPVEWARNVNDADALVSEALRIYKKHVAE